MNNAVQHWIKTAQHEGLDNIIPIISGKPVVDLPSAFANAVLFYDVLHYFYYLPGQLERIDLVSYCIE